MEIFSSNEHLTIAKTHRVVAQITKNTKNGTKCSKWTQKDGEWKFIGQIKKPTNEKKMETKFRFSAVLGHMKCVLQIESKLLIILNILQCLKRCRHIYIYLSHAMSCLCDSFTDFWKWNCIAEKPKI